jgi:hypothetical protein
MESKALYAHYGSSGQGVSPAHTEHGALSHIIHVRLRTENPCYHFKMWQELRHQTVVSRDKAVLREVKESS